MIKAGLGSLAASSKVFDELLRATHRSAMITFRAHPNTDDVEEDVENNLKYFEGQIETIQFAAKQLAASAEAVWSTIP